MKTFQISDEFSFQMDDPSDGMKSPGVLGKHSLLKNIHNHLRNTVVANKLKNLRKGEGYPHYDLQFLSRFQFHQRVYAQLLRTQVPKAQKDSQLKQLFALSGSACVKAARKHVNKIDPGRSFKIDSYELRND